MKIIAHPDIDVVGSISRDEDGVLSVRLTHVDGELGVHVKDKFRVFVDTKMIFGRKRKPKPLPPLDDDLDVDI